MLYRHYLCSLETVKLRGRPPLGHMLFACARGLLRAMLIPPFHFRHQFSVSEDTFGEIVIIYLLELLGVILGSKLSLWAAFGASWAPFANHWGQWGINKLTDAPPMFVFDGFLGPQNGHFLHKNWAKSGFEQNLEIELSPRREPHFWRSRAPF